MSSFKNADKEKVQKERSDSRRSEAVSELRQERLAEVQLSKRKKQTAKPAYPKRGRRFILGAKLSMRSLKISANLRNLESLGD